MTWSADTPYNALPPLPPRVEVETREVLKATIEARAAIAALDQAVRRIANPVVLINAIPLLEAQASSEIENIVTTNDELFRFAQEDAASSSPAVKETLRYRSALFAGVAMIRERPLSVSTAVEVCAKVKNREMPVRRMPGTYIGNPATRQAIYTPPVGEDVIREKLAEWEQFVHTSETIDPLVVMALAHYQFEAIHPFEDGNGRTARIINVLLLMHAGLIHQPILYLSRYVIANKDEYYRLLLAVTRDGSWVEWVTFMLEGIRQTAQSTVVKIDEIQTLQDRALGVIRAVVGVPNVDLLAVLFEQPYCRISNVVERCGVSRPTATKWLNDLVAVGMLADVRRGRERIFINTELFEVLTRPEATNGAGFEPTLF